MGSNIEMDLEKETVEESVAQENVAEENVETSPEASANEDEAAVADVDFEAQDLDMEEAQDEPEADVAGSELESFESAEIEEKIFIDEDQMYSIIESILFSTDRPVTAQTIKQAFKGTTVNLKKIRKAIEEYGARLAASDRGVYLEQISGGYQLRTKQDNVDFLKALKKERPFKLSGPALEVLAIVSYEQPCIKARVDEIRAVESGHLMRALMDKGLLSFAGKSELPGKPMLYKTTKKFLEIFGLKSLQELPSLDEIDSLIPEGIGDEEDEKSLDELTEGMDMETGQSYSESEGELLKISDDLSKIDTSTDFFEEEKRREKEKRDRERAEDIRMALEDNEDVDKKDIKWLERYEARLAQEQEEREKAEVEAKGASANESSDAETETKADADPDSSSETDSDAETSTDNEMKAETDTNTDADTGALTDTEADSGVEAAASDDATVADETVSTETEDLAPKPSDEVTP